MQDETGAQGHKTGGLGHLLSVVDMLILKYR